MPEIIDLTGQKFGRLRVLAKYGRTADRSTVWKSECDCGKIVYPSSRDLRQRHTKSCGCLRLEICPNKLRPFEAIYRRTIKAASSRNLEHTLTYDEYLEFTKIENCHYCNGIIPWIKYNHVAGKTSSPYFLDRMDNLKGYIKDNLVVSCTRCNRGKMHLFSYAEWKEIGALLRAIENKENYAYIHKT